MSIVRLLFKYTEKLEETGDEMMEYKILCKSCGISLSEYERLEYQGECIDCYREKQPKNPAIHMPVLKRLRNRKYMAVSELR